MALAEQQPEGVPPSPQCQRHLGAMTVHFRTVTGQHLDVDDAHPADTLAKLRARV
eukprot:COSAG02_NODE_3220_length_7154_cov_12.889157_7_plen_54_part_01